MQIIGANGQPHSLDVWNFTMDVNLTGTFNLTRIACKYLVMVPSEGPDGERGVVVMVASTAAVRWYSVRHFLFSPFAKKMALSSSTQFEAQPGQVAYAATKGALVSMTLPMARDLEPHGIRVVTIAPSAFTTPMVTIMKPKVREGISRNLLFPRRMGEPREFGQTVKWILECPYVNGETIRLSGGSRFPGKL
jgi:3-hydroxyacyl-CoA dehydrogenase / 3-hydroxy-2-methylbutyryl-CoA dehydrogenase